MNNILKRLEINGFKSFAQKTVLEFPPGITAIVGPNGSGKSNVIDAIRWLLGERDAKNLRGGKVEDLIFGGTPSKARLGQAQAGIYFENKNKFFPVDFEELGIVRQVNRDGTSQYFLNKSEVRLKDLIDLFARARLGSKGLTVIGQGESDIFVKTSPQGRRAMIEEMLGLREYQLKKADAERRLKNAQINLDKAQALIEEILPHLRSLKRQAHRWEKRSTLEEELNNLEGAYFGSRFQELRKELSAIERDIASHENQKEELLAAKQKAENHLEEVESLQPKEREALEDIKRSIRDLTERRSALQKDIGKLEAQIELSDHHGSIALPSPERLFDFVKKVKNSLQMYAERDAQELHRTIKVILKEIDQILNELPDFSKANDKALPLKAQLEKIAKESSTIERELAIYHEKEKELGGQQENFYGAFKKAIHEVEAAKDAIEKWETVYQQKQFAKERVSLRVNELEHQITQAGKHPETFSDYKGGAEAGHDYSEMERKILRLRGELAAIGEIDETLVKEAQETETRYEFLKKESEDLERAKGNLNQLISELREKIQTEFSDALTKINQEFTKFFYVMFGGGHAKLKILKKKKEEKAKAQEEAVAGTEEPPAIAGEENRKEDEEGIEIEVGLPRKKIHSLEMLSGGERSLTAIAALFAMISVSPPPFLVLDEVDAALDERNARRFSEMLKEFSHKTQFIVVTHNRATMEAANVLYGVTMNENGTSKVLSLKLEKEPVPIS